MQPAVTQGELAERVWREAGQSGTREAWPAMSRGAATGARSRHPRRSARCVELWYEFDAPYVVDASGFERTFGVTASSWEQVMADLVAPR